MSGERKAAVIGDVEYSKKRVKQEYEEAIRQLRLQANMDALLKAVNKFGVFEDSNEPAKELLDRLTNGEADDGLFSFVGSRIRRNSNFVMRDPKRYEPVYIEETMSTRPASSQPAARAGGPGALPGNRLALLARPKLPYIEVLDRQQHVAVLQAESTRRRAVIRTKKLKLPLHGSLLNDVQLFDELFNSEMRKRSLAIRKFRTGEAAEGVRQRAQLFMTQLKSELDTQRSGKSS